MLDSSPKSHASTSSKAKVIFFDAAGTLIAPHPSVGHIYARVAAWHGFRLSSGAVNRHFRETWKKRGGLRTLLPQPGADLYVSEKIWWEEFVAETMAPFKLGRHFNNFFNDLYKIFEEKGCWRVFPDVKRALSSLKNKGVRMGVISNWDTRLITLLKTLDLSRFFDKIIVSSQARAAKPDPMIFKKAARFFERNPGECLHVGNDFEEDYRGALEAGFSAILLDRTGKTRLRCSRIGSLGELIKGELNAKLHVHRQRRAFIT